MPSISEESKNAIDSLSIDELRYEVNLGSRSRFEREQLAYLNVRLAALKDAARKSAKDSELSVFGITIPIRRRHAILTLVVLGLAWVLWNWEQIAIRIGLSTAESPTVIEQDIADLRKDWKLCIGSPGCSPGMIKEIADDAESLIQRAATLSGEDRRDLVAKATAILDETRQVVRPFPTDGVVPMERKKQ